MSKLVRGWNSIKNPFCFYDHVFYLHNILRNPPLCSLASFWIVLLTPFKNKPESSRDLTILIMSFISSFDIISVVNEGELSKAEEE